MEISPPAADSDKCRDPQPNRGWSLGTLIGRVGGRAEGPKGDRNSTGKPKESTNLDPWSSQKLNYQPKSIHRLDLELHPTPTSVADV
jgi:hypothetical protein